MENTIIVMRLDKFLADMSVGTRSELKKSIRKGMVKVNNEVIKSPDYKVSASDVISYAGEKIAYIDEVYFMMNKPAGIVSATEDRHDKTVIDLLSETEELPKGVFPVGRLDKDTEGLLLLTNNGALAHELLSPKKHVDKVYYAKVDGYVDAEIIELFREGVDIGEKNLTLPADLKVLKSDDVSEVEITIREGKFHQIKRMFTAVEKEVLYLKRIQMGSLYLDENLELGAVRPLTVKEIEALCLKI